MRYLLSFVGGGCIGTGGAALALGLTWGNTPVYIAFIGVGVMVLVLNALAD
jgi:hypothetical protein